MDQEVNNKAQVSEFIGTAQVVVRSGSAEETLQILDGFAKNADQLTDSLKALRSAAQIKGLMDGGSKPPTTGGFKDNPVNSTPSAPPTPPQEVGNCNHGMPWQDKLGVRGRNGQVYKKRYYCANEDRNNQCTSWGSNG